MVTVTHFWRDVLKVTIPHALTDSVVAYEALMPNIKKE